MTFASPLWLFTLALVPLGIAAARTAHRRAGRYAIRFPAVSTVQMATGSRSAWLRHVPAALALAAVAALALALTRPHVSYGAAVGDGAVMLVTDHSGSMASTDVSPTRLAAAEQAANTFIGEQPGSVRIGAIAFSSSPDAVQAPETNHNAARAIINGQAAGGGTATGDALALALQLLHGGQAKHPPAAIVLLSDGAANAGVNVLTVAHQAAKEHIPIFTVALGTPNGTLPNPDPFFPAVAVPPDPQLMQQIAQASGGRAFNAQSADELSSIYKRLGGQLGVVTRQREVTAEFAIGGLVLLALAALGSTRLVGRLP
ncbi:MAG TPA: VWA domain-containing protein [Solirubrobacteraceae bacterium]|nr:VWA domain-containing protein [Solirubrobacteraceae bacterium]